MKNDCDLWVFMFEQIDKKLSEQHKEVMRLEERIRYLEQSNSRYLGIALVIMFVVSTAITIGIKFIGV